MKSLLAGVTVKPLLYAVGVLLLVIATMAAVWWVQATTSSAALDVSKAAASACNAADTANRARVRELEAANQGWELTTATLQTELKAAQDQLVTVRQQGRAAVAAAEARAADADRTLSTFMARYAAQVKQAHCVQALQHVEAVCPAFSGY
ncbi:hypothetical protein CSC62_07530 [Pseudoxanthomonas jiangsuensis]|uniref:hypothetical protein n=1 Tax=Pseudoxanthomonas jiangsuensis TaxID=619688 RepID=UPI001390B863|nr:hypothetical protein [Pseudoxanthomonas jiangsuensis]KAF1697987.1 hypothetical protein CSC62_07530 [Pseudoxanthomonas jiangsuensis]